LSLGATAAPVELGGRGGVGRECVAQCPATRQADAQSRSCVCQRARGDHVRPRPEMLVAVA